MKKTVARLLAVIVTVLLACGGDATSAFAATETTLDRWDADYVVGTDGVTSVTETLVVRWGTSSGRHGYVRDIITREKYDDKNDAMFPISNVSVSSPDPKISTKFELKTETGSSPRSEVTRVKIGDANKTISGATTMYVIKYQQRGLLRNPKPDFDEFYIDVLGAKHQVVASSTIKVTVPGGVQDVACFVGPTKSTTACDQASVTDGVATFVAKKVPDGHLFTIDAKITKGAAGTAAPLTEKSATQKQTDMVTGSAVLGGLASIVMAVSMWFYYRGRSRDERFVGMPPGTFPPPGTDQPVGRDTYKEIPVAFSAPRLALAHAGYLLEGCTKTSHFTATVVGLATNGAIRLSGMAPVSGQKPVREAHMADVDRVPDQPSLIVFNELFESSPSRNLDDAEMGDGWRTFVEETENTSQNMGWFKTTFKGGKSSVVWVILWIALFFFFNESPTVLLAGIVILGIMTVAWLVLQLIVRKKMSRGQRTATGRAYTDQVEGFRTYLATAEANQLKFQEGEDIFTKYLPWAILFGLTDRWTKVCSEAVERGLIAAPDTSWYGGGPWYPDMLLYGLGHWDFDFGSSLPGLAEGIFDGVGFGGGSGFDGGGFSGGGFGGGGGTDW